MENPLIRTIGKLEKLLRQMDVKEASFVEGPSQPKVVTNHDKSRGFGLGKRIGDWKSKIETSIVNLGTPITKETLPMPMGMDLTMLERRGEEPLFENPNCPVGSSGTYSKGYAAMNQMRRR